MINEKSDLRLDWFLKLYHPIIISKKCGDLFCGGYKYSGTEIVTKIKSITARELFKRFPELRKELWGGEFWSDGYYIATVGERGNWNIVKKYIENQGKTVEQAQLRLLI